MLPRLLIISLLLGAFVLGGCETTILDELEDVQQEREDVREELEELEQERGDVREELEQLEQEKMELREELYEEENIMDLREDELVYLEGVPTFEQVPNARYK